jgi:quercetin dioxygenase-like cupin family protein
MVARTFDDRNGTRVTNGKALTGDATEFRSATQRVVREGEAILSDRNTTHWWRNDGSTTVTFVAADIFRPQ